MTAADRRPPLPLLTSDEMRRWDRRAVERLGVPERVLMESAGRAAARVLHRLFPRGPVAAAVGRGNNGGDAVVLLRCLRAWGREVLAVPIGGAEISAELCHGWDLPTAPESEAERAFASAAALVDGILGTGGRGAPREPQAAAVRALNAAGRPVVALDGPTGVDLSDGSAPGEAVRADVTLAFGAPKRGLLLFPGRRLAGRILVLEVGFPPLEAEEASAAVITLPWARSLLPSVPADAHKGTAGSVAVLAGSPGMGGAAVMVATGALRAGAGMARVVSSADNRVPVHCALPEAVFVDREGGGVDDALEASDSAVAGPGLGQDDAALRLLRGVVDRSDLPLLLDADALTLLSRDPKLIAGGRGERFLLTPHPGEMGRLLGIETAEVAADPFAAAERAAERFGCAVLLKGAPSLVAGGAGPVLANLTGHAGVATGGMGDTLAGIGGALLARGLPPRDAAALAVCFAGRAAERAGRGRGLLPRDVAEALPGALQEEPAPSAPDLPDVLLDLPAAR